MPSSKTPITLEPINLHDPIQFTELQRHRVICGWDHEDSVLIRWRTAIDSHQKSMFWVIPATLSSSLAPLRYAGHVAMYKQTYDNPQNIDAPLPDLSTMALGTLFILPEHRGKGLAGGAVKVIEGMAKIEPYGWKECRAMTLNTLARKYVEDEEWRKVGKWPHENMGTPLPDRGMSNEDWYVRMGYVKWKEVPLYRAKDRDGETFVFDATFMWKELK